MTFVTNQDSGKSASKLSYAEMKAKFEQQAAELEALKQAKAPKITAMKIGEKGALSIYGLQRFPVTLYAEQWNVLLNASDSIRAFINANSGKLAVKGSK